MNIKFSYLYRDYSNYKKFNEIVFSNPANKPLEEIRKIIKECLIEDEWFYVSEWQVPDLHFRNWDNEDDHFLHEFESIEVTDEESEKNNTIDDLLITIRKAKKEKKKENYI